MKGCKVRLIELHSTEMGLDSLDRGNSIINNPNVGKKTHSVLKSASSAVCLNQELRLQWTSAVSATQDIVCYFNKFMEPWNYYFNQDTDYFHHPRILAHAHVVIHFLPLAPGNHGSFCHCRLVLLILKMLGKCNHAASTLSAWLLSLRIMFLRLIHAVEYISSFFIFYRNISLHRCTIIYSFSYWGAFGLFEAWGYYE